MTASIRVEVVFALPDKQRLVAVTLPTGATVADAISQSSMSRQFPDERLDDLEVGVWGRHVTRDHILSDGDRVEVLRPLELDPREARRQLALLGQTMGNTPKR